MKIYIKEQDHGVSDGAQMLRVLQNTTTPRIDLLVRESIQNSLDAGFVEKDIFVDYSIKTINTEVLNSQFESLTYNNPEDNKLLIISDKNTTGLTGSYDYGEESLSSLLKLVYNFGKPQENIGAGGSWGYGKTIYFRVGKGLVIYYSRIKQDNGLYEERLAASLVEDQNKEGSLIDYGTKRKNGIAWWGDLSRDGRSIPITDGYKIGTILKSIGVERYSGNDTGTRIIIPYLQEDELFEEAKKSISLYETNGSNHDDKKAIYDNFDEYLKGSIERWYIPRLNNPSYSYGKKNNLIASINKEPLTTENQEQIFKVIKSMYNYAITGDNKEFYNLTKNSEVFQHEVNVSLGSKKDYISSNLLGTLIYAKVSYKDLNMSTLYDIVNPYTLLNMKNYVVDTNKNEPIIIYTRQPGMIINYTFDNVWSIKNFDTPKDEYLIGFFVLNSNSNAHLNTIEGKLSFEEYFRSNENADHMEWHDKAITFENKVLDNLGFIRRITRSINAKIKDQFKPEDDTSTTSVTEQVSSIFGDRIMPSLGFGNRSNKKTIKPTNTLQRSASGRYLSSEVKYHEAEYKDESTILIPFDFSFKETRETNIQIEILIDSESRKYDLNHYEKEIGAETPIYIEDIHINDFKPTQAIRMVARTSRKPAAFKYEATYIEGKVYKGIITVKYNDKLVSPIIIIKEVNENE